MIDDIVTVIFETLEDEIENEVSEPKSAVVELVDPETPEEPVDETENEVSEPKSVEVTPVDPVTPEEPVVETENEVSEPKSAEVASADPETPEAPVGETENKVTEPNPIEVKPIVETPISNTTLIDTTETLTVDSPVETEEEVVDFWLDADNDSTIEVTTPKP